MFRHVPNLLTGARLVLAAVFFALLGFYQYEGRGQGLLNVAFIIYCVALVTDFLDGYLARLWKVEGAFGRVVDPFVDKVLVIGSFIFFAGKNFIIPSPPGKYVVYTITGVAPWMVVVILARELLVTSFRGLGEGTGQNFGAAFSGKVKMAVQSVTILVVLVYVNYFAIATRRGTPGEWYFHRFRDVCVWITVAVTVLSGFAYVRRALIVASRHEKTPAVAADD